MNGVIPGPDQRAGAAAPVPGEGAWRGTFEPPVLPPRAARARGAWRQDVARLLREPFSRRARMERWYAGLGLLLAIPAFVFTVVAVTVGLGLSLSFAGMLVGLPLLVVTLLTARQLGAVCRRMAGRMLGLRVPPPPPPPSRPPGVVGWVRAGVTDPAGWRAFGYLVLKLPVAVISAVVASWFLVYGLSYLTFPLWWEVLHQLGVVVTVPQWMAWWKQDPVTVAMSVRTLAGAFALVPVGAAVLIAVPWLTRAVLAIDRAMVAGLLGPPLPQRVRDLEQTRARAVDDSAARLRRIERDLHDGAQAQMVAVAMKLGLAREKLGGAADGTTPADLERALQLVDAAHASAKQAITELRDLAHGIHPPVLDHGLGTALTTLAASSGVPVELVVDLPERPSAAIETIAYFCAAELLANVAKHSGARRATLEAVHVPGLLRLRVSDDGVGGVRIVAGSGLAGLAERLRTVDGQMEISSPRGGPTVVTVELPSHA
jgi:signal transduction histidine kinase